MKADTRCFRRAIVVLMISWPMLLPLVFGMDSKLAFTYVPPSENSNDEIDTPGGVNDGEAESGIPQLPASDPDTDMPSIKLGESLKLDQMGPVIINTDGTTRRIDNWDQMTEKEKEVTWRRISKRNEARRKMLMDEMEQGEHQNPNSNEL